MSKFVFDKKVSKKKDYGNKIYGTKKQVEFYIH